MPPKEGTRRNLTKKALATGCAQRVYWLKETGNDRVISQYEFAEDIPAAGLHAPRVANCHSHSCHLGLPSFAHFRQSQDQGAAHDLSLQPPATRRRVDA